MASSTEEEDKEFDDIFSTLLSTVDLKFLVKEEQKNAIKNLYFGRDVLAVLPTGFGKSLIFQLLVLLHSEDLRTVLVVCPLRSLIEDQIQEVQDFGIKATSLPEASLDEIKEGKWQIVFSSPECALNKKFLKCLKEGKFHDNLVAVVIDESHTIETWTGRRKSFKSKKMNDKVFRKAFGELAKLRSFCKEGTPFLALTGTADENTIDCIQQDLLMRGAVRIFVSPERKNVIFTVKKVNNDAEMFSQLIWLMELIKKTEVNCPKTLIFCNTLNDIAKVFNRMMLYLGSSAYSSPDSKSPDYCMIGMYHSNTFPDQKKRLLAQFKGQGKKRIIVTSTALSMGVNFPDIKYIVNWGPARNLLDQLQEAGRAGRDGKKSHNIIIYHGWQLSHCNKDVKDFIRSNGCFRVAAYHQFDKSVSPSHPNHDCCSFCRKSCVCRGKDCPVTFDFDTQQAHVSQHSYHSRLVRLITEQDKKDVKDALNELVDSMNQVASHGFPKEFIEDIVKNCQWIFSVDDIKSQFPVISTSHAYKIIEVLNEIFNDIPEEYFESDSVYSLYDDLEHFSFSESGSEEVVFGDLFE